MKLIGSDYDGTLNHGGIDEAKLSAIRRWRAAGNIFGVVSGRGPDFLAELTDKLGDNFDFYASCNGGVAVDACGDHRMVMLAAAAALCCREPVTVPETEALDKSWPDYLNVYASLGGRAE